jgi:hypothetical protein
MVEILHGWFSTLHVFHLIQKFNMAATTNSFWCWNFKIFSETTRGMNMLFCRNVSYLTLLNSFVFVHRKSKMATAAGQIKESNWSQKLDIWLNPNWTWVMVGWSLRQLSFFSDNQKSKMIMWTNLTYDRKGKTFHNYSYLKQLKHL